LISGKKSLICDFNIIALSLFSLLLLYLFITFDNFDFKLVNFELQMI